MRSDLRQIALVPVEHRTTIVYALHDIWTVWNEKRDFIPLACVASSRAWLQHSHAAGVILISLARLVGCGTGSPNSIMVRRLPQYVVGGGNCVSKILWPRRH